MSILNFFRKGFRFVRSFVVTIDLYKINMENFKEFDIEEDSNFDFCVLSDIGDIHTLENILQERGERFRLVVEERLSSGNYLAFIYKDKGSQQAAYYRWLTSSSFFHDRFLEEITLDKANVFTLDSYTSFGFRGQGLHKKMNMKMLNYCKKDLKCQSVSMVIFRGKAYDHLHKTVKELGYKLEKSKTYFKFR